MHKINNTGNGRGSAAARCGEAPPHRQPILSRLRLDTWRLSLNNFKARLAGKAEPFRTVRRQSRGRFGDSSGPSL